MFFSRFRKIKTKSVKDPKYMNEKELATFEPSPFICPDKKLMLMISGKCGSTFATCWLLFQMNLLDAVFFYSDRANDFFEIYLKSNGYLKHRYDFIEDKNYTVIKIVRNPYERVVSSYFQALAGAGSRGPIDSFLGRRTTKKKTFSFAEFISYLESIDLNRCDPHQQAQLHPLEKYGVIKPSHIIDLKNMNKKLRDLEKELNLKEAPLEEIQSRISHHTIRYKTDKFCGEEYFPGWETEYPIADDFYNEELRERVAALYKEDYEAYGFQIT